MLLYGASLRRAAHAKADIAEAVAAGYAGCRSKEGARALEKMLQALRGE